MSTDTGNKPLSLIARLRKLPYIAEQSSARSLRRVGSSSKVRQDTVTDPLYKTNCSLEDYLALESRKELAVEELM